LIFFHSKLGCRTSVAALQFGRQIQTEFYNSDVLVCSIGTHFSDRTIYNHNGKAENN